MKLKICGVKSVDEARQLRQAGVDLVGLNFIRTSSRCISLKQAETIMAELVGSDIQTAALFAGHFKSQVNDYADRLKVDYVQLHGDEPASYAKGLNCKVIRAVGVNSQQTADELIQLIKNYPADRFVLDRERQGQGAIIDPKLAARVVSALPGRIFLAGGLSPDNLADVLSKVQPYGIDIAGGVRGANDDLDISKVRRCLDTIRKSGD